MAAGQLLQPSVEPFRVLPLEVRDGPDANKAEVGREGGADPGDDPEGVGASGAGH